MPWRRLGRPLVHAAALRVGAAWAACALAAAWNLAALAPRVPSKALRIEGTALPTAHPLTDRPLPTPAPAGRLCRLRPRDLQLLHELLHGARPL